MRSRRFFLAFLAVIFLMASLPLHAECTNEQDHRSNKTSGLLITDFTITGTQTLGSDDLARIESALTGMCFDENSEELEERVRTLFQDRGYFKSVVKSVSVKPNDVLAIPKPATLEAEVLEGPRYKIGEIKFVGNHAFSTAKLRSGFPVRKGELFDRSKIATGIDNMVKLYASDGFIDWVAQSDANVISDTTVAVALSVTEGPQYRMAKLEVFATKEVAAKLLEAWQLPEGTVFDRAYVEEYVSENSALLPLGFTSQDVQLVRNCPDASVAVVLMLGGIAPSESMPKKVDCEPPNGASK